MQIPEQQVLMELQVLMARLVLQVPTALLAKPVLRALRAILDPQVTREHKVFMV
jgi:hypothetical protein